MIQYCSEEVRFTLPNKRSNNAWLRQVAAQENRVVGDLSIIFCSDPYLLDINRRFLGHDYYTDIITFDYCEGNRLSGDLFISIDSVRANAVEYGTSFGNELARVMVHGVLHLIGYDDHTPEDQVVMRHKEDTYLSLLERL